MHHSSSQNVITSCSFEATTSVCELLSELDVTSLTAVRSSQSRLLAKRKLVSRRNLLLLILKILCIGIHFCVTISCEENFTIFESTYNNDIIFKSNLTNKSGLSAENRDIQNVSFKVLTHHPKHQQQSSSESAMIDDSDFVLPFTQNSLRYKKLTDSKIQIFDKLNSYNSAQVSSTVLPTTTTSSSKIDERRKFLIKKGRFARQLLLTKTIKSQSKKENESLEELYKDLEILKPCNRTIDTLLVHRLLSDSIKDLERNLSIYSQLFKLNPMLSYPIDGLFFEYVITLITSDYNFCYFYER